MTRRTGASSLPDAREGSAGWGYTVGPGPVICASSVAGDRVGVRAVAAGGTDVIILNFANPDMVGHTGKLDAAIRAVETVDASLGCIRDEVVRRGGAILLTSDHGNCEQMIDYETGAPHTYHTTNPVPFVAIGEGFRGAKLRKGGRLCDLAPTMLKVLGIPQPPEMTGESLV